MAGPENAGAQPYQPMNASERFHRMAAALLEWHENSNDIMSDLFVDADAAGIGGRLGGLLKKASQAMCRTLYAILSRDEQYLNRHAILRGYTLSCTNSSANRLSDISWVKSKSAQAARRKSRDVFGHTKHCASPPRGIA